jgi:hypothetical protein
MNGDQKECKRNRPSLARGARYAGNGRDKISYRIIRKRVVAVVERRSVPSASASRENEIANGGCRYVAERDGQ